MLLLSRDRRESVTAAEIVERVSLLSQERGESGVAAATSEPRARREWVGKSSAAIIILVILTSHNI